MALVSGLALLSGVFHAPKILAEDKVKVYSTAEVVDTMFFDSLSALLDNPALYVDSLTATEIDSGRRYRYLSLNTLRFSEINWESVRISMSMLEKPFPDLGDIESPGMFLRMTFTSDPSPFLENRNRPASVSYMVNHKGRDYNVWDFYDDVTSYLIKPTGTTREMPVTFEDYGENRRISKIFVYRGGVFTPYEYTQVAWFLLDDF